MSRKGDKVIITCALCGGATTREMTPYVPNNPQEIIDQAVEAAEAGAAIVHIHGRDKNGVPTIDFDVFEEIYNGIRARSNIVINLTSAHYGATDDARIKPFSTLKPEIASLDVGSMNWLHLVLFENTPQFLERAAAEMLEAGVVPELECFDGGWIDNARHLIKKGLIRGNPFWFNFVLGAAGGARADVRTLQYLVDCLPENSEWSTFSIGSKTHMEIMYAAVAMGGNIRVGLEDSIYMSKGVLAKSNAEMVDRAVQVVHTCNKFVASPDEAREILNLRR